MSLGCIFVQDSRSVNTASSVRDIIYQSTNAHRRVQAVVDNIKGEELGEGGKNKLTSTAANICTGVNQETKKLKLNVGRLEAL